MIDVLYLAWNRLEYTRKTFELLLSNTNWQLVHRLYVYDDGSVDGTSQYLHEAISRAPVPVSYVVTSKRSPVASMLDYLNVGAKDVEMFVKLDNDIALPTGWLDALADVMFENPDLDILGMQAGRQQELVEQGIVSASEIERSLSRGWVEAPHIGGVGIMRRSAFDRRLPHPDGRFGFTSWQQQFDDQPGPWPPLVRGWIIPDIPCPQLDFLPFAPWNALSQVYRDQDWQRYRDVGGARQAFWPEYDPANHEWWDWMEEEAA